MGQRAGHPRVTGLGTPYFYPLIPPPAKTLIPRVPVLGCQGLCPYCSMSQESLPS